MIGNVKRTYSHGRAALIMRLHLMEGRRLVSLDGAGTEPILRGASLVIDQGDLIAVLGAPGSGKTTLLRILGLLEPPASGQLWFENRLISGLPELELNELRRTQISLDPANPARLLLVDEPPPALCTRLLERPGTDQTILFSTTDPLMASRASSIYRLRNGLLHRLDRP